MGALAGRAFVELSDQETYESKMKKKTPEDLGFFGPKAVEENPKAPAEENPKEEASISLPEGPPPSTSNVTQARVIHSYEAQGETNLSISAGECVILLDVQGVWSQVFNTKGGVGWVPTVAIKVLQKQAK
jgi:hypothetical protein